MRRDLIDRAWATGFWEGEGSITANGHMLMLTASQKEPEVLDRFAAIWGVGSVHPSHGDRMFIYRCFGAQAQRVATTMWPELSERRQRQIIFALIRYASRRVRDPRRCRRGHLFTPENTYLAPSGGRECRTCIAARRHGPLPRAELPTAFEARVGVREYRPGVAA